MLARLATPVPTREMEEAGRPIRPPLFLSDALSYRARSSVVLLILDSLLGGSVFRTGSRPRQEFHILPIKFRLVQVILDVDQYFS